MEETHTPGPWYATDSGVRDRGGYICHTLSAQRYEGQDERYEREKAERAANKTLIAAAPELLEALIEVSASLSWLAFGECRAFHDRRIMNAAEATGKAKAAIAKATS